MASRVAVIALDAVDAEALARFWCAVLGWEVVKREPGGLTLGAADGAWPQLDIFAVPEAKTELKNRLHLDLRADGISTAEELDRLLALGATHADVGQPPDADWTVLADPEGNEFCLLAKTVQER